MNRIEDLLREEFGRLAVPEVVPDAMLARVERVRRRRLVGAAVGGAALLAILAVTAYAVLPAILPRPDGAPADTPRLPASTFHANVQMSTLFTDRRHGYVLEGACAWTPASVQSSPGGAVTTTPPRGDYTCLPVLFVTADAGHTWQRRTTPLGLIKDYSPASLVASIRGLGNQRLWVDDDGRLAVGGADLLLLGTWLNTQDHWYWATADEGRTWRKVPMPEESPPVGWLTAIDAHGHRTVLAKRPVNHSMMIGQAGGTDGSFWVEDSQYIYVTHDHGETWQKLSIQDLKGPVYWVSTYDGRTVYAAARDKRPQPGDPPLAGTQLVRSTDGGATWSRVGHLPLESLTGLVLPNGDMLTTNPTDPITVYRVKAGASTWDTFTGLPKNVSTLYATGGVAVAELVYRHTHNNQVDRVDIVATVSSDNGATWHPVPLATD